MTPEGDFSDSVFNLSTAARQLERDPCTFEDFILSLVCAAGQAGPIDGRTFPCSNVDLVYFLDIDDLSGGQA